MVEKSRYARNALVLGIIASISSILGFIITVSIITRDIVSYSNVLAVIFIIASPIVGIMAIINGIAALIEIKKKGLSGKYDAILGIILGCSFILISILLSSFRTVLI